VQDQAVVRPWYVTQHQPGTTDNDRIDAGHRATTSQRPAGSTIGREITQIYEGTNQIQRMVMARALLNG
jgi:alkylation response protein AidB-like acyl-CoA dehydrogenase